MRHDRPGRVIVEVEVDTAQGLPGMDIVETPDQYPSTHKSIKGKCTMKIGRSNQVQPFPGAVTAPICCIMPKLSATVQ